MIKLAIVHLHTHVAQVLVTLVPVDYENVAILEAEQEFPLLPRYDVVGRHIPHRRVQTCQALADPYIQHHVALAPVLVLGLMRLVLARELHAVITRGVENGATNLFRVLLTLALGF